MDTKQLAAFGAGLALGVVALSYARAQDKKLTAKLLRAGPSEIRAAAPVTIEKRLAGRVAVVTGSGIGIGRTHTRNLPAICLWFCVRSSLRDCL